MGSLPSNERSGSAAADADRPGALPDIAHCRQTGDIEPASSRHEIELRQSEARLRILTEIDPRGILVLNEESIILFANPAVKRMFGYPGEELVGRHLDLLIPERFREAHRLGVEHYLATGKRRISWAGHEFVGLRRGGEEFPIDIAFGEYLESGKHVFVGFVRDISEWKAAERERQELLESAQRAREEAEAANRSKSDFLASMSHEIRTPINAIMGYAELLGMGLKGPVTEGQKAQLERIRVSSQHLLGLVNDVLDLAKVEAGQLKVEHECGVAADAVSAAIALVDPQAKEKGIEIQDLCRSDAPVFYVGDPDRVRQILVNLIGNAIKFNRTEGKVQVTCKDSDTGGSGRIADCVQIQVTDTGRGIPPEMVDRIFDSFMQVDAGHTRESEGTGLGLPISRQLARLMGGEITVRSVVGEGSVFTLWLPRGSPRDARSLEEEMIGQPHAGGADLGDLMLDHMDAIIERYVSELRHEREIRRLPPVSDADLEDHSAVFLAAIARSLSALQDARTDPILLMRDGTAIQRVISERHGAQRARLGWNEELLHKDFQIMREAIEAVVHEQAHAHPDAASEEALELLGPFLEYAESVSLTGMRRAAASDA